MWDKLYHSGKYKWTKPNKLVVNTVPLFKKRNVKRILDLACGNGRHIVYLCKENFFVVGSDISSIGLMQAQEWLNKEGISNYSLIQNDMSEKLPFPDEHFDAVVSIQAIEHNKLAGLKKTVNEIRRVLKKGGFALVTILSTKDHKFGIGRKLEKDTYLAGKTDLHHFFDEKGARELFSKFKIIKMEEIIEVLPKEAVVHSYIRRMVKEKMVKIIHWEIFAQK